MLLIPLALAAALVLAIAGRSMVAVVVVAVLAALAVATVGLKDHPEYLVPIMIYTLWFEVLGVGPITMGRVLALLAPVVILARTATSTWRPRALMPRAWVAVFLFTAWAWCGGFYGLAVSGTSGWLYQFFAYALGVCYWIAFAVLLEGPEQLLRLLRAWVWIGVPIALIAVVIYFTFGNRVFGFSGGPNQYAGYAVTTLPFILLFGREAKGRMRIAYFGIIPIYLGALLATGSRAGLLSGFVMGTYIVLTLPGVKLRRRVILVVAGFTGMLALAFLFALLNPERFSLAAIFSDRGAGRLDIWNAGMQVAREHWLFGLGLGGFAGNAIKFMQQANNTDITILGSEEVIAQGGINAHNVYLALVLDNGVIGLVLYLSIIAGALKNLWDLRKNPRWFGLTWAFTGAVITNLAAGMFGGALNSKFFWLSAGAAAGMYFRRRLTAPRGSRRLAMSRVTTSTAPPVAEAG